MSAPLNLGKFGSIDLTKLTAGISEEDIEKYCKDDKKLKEKILSVFRKLDIDNSKKLEIGELESFISEVQAEAGEDNTLSKEEQKALAHNMSNQENKIDRKTFMQFLQALQSTVDKNIEMVTNSQDQSSQTIKYNNGTEQEIGVGGEKKSTTTTDSNGVITKTFYAQDGTTVTKTVVEDPSKGTKVTTVYDGENIKSQTTVDTQNKTEVTIHYENGKPTTKTVYQQTKEGQVWKVGQESYNKYMATYDLTDTTKDLSDESAWTLKNQDYSASNGTTYHAEISNERQVVTVSQANGNRIIEAYNVGTDGTPVLDSMITETKSDGKTIRKTYTYKNGDAQQYTMRQESIDDETNETSLMSSSRTIQNTQTGNYDIGTIRYQDGNTLGAKTIWGETINSLAQTYGCSVEEFLEVNPQLKNQKRNSALKQGTEYVIPGERTAEDLQAIRAGRVSNANAKHRAMVEAQRAREAEEAEIAAMNLVGRKNDAIQKAKADDTYHLLGMGASLLLNDSSIPEARRAELRKQLFTSSQPKKYTNTIYSNQQTFKGAATEILKEMHANNPSYTPTKAEIDAVVADLKKLNPQLKDGKLRGEGLKYVTDTYQPNLDNTPTVIIDRSPKALEPKLKSVPEIVQILTADELEKVVDKLSDKKGVVRQGLEEAYVKDQYENRTGKKFTGYRDKEYAQIRRDTFNERHRQLQQRSSANTYEDFAKNVLKNILKVENPTDEQIQTLAKQIKDANPNLKDGELKNQVVKFTVSPEIYDQFMAEKSQKEDERLNEFAKSNEANKASGKEIADNLYNALDGYTSRDDVKIIKENLANLNADNVIYTVHAFNEKSPKENLVEYILREDQDEWLASGKDTRIDAVRTVFNKLLDKLKTTDPQAYNEYKTQVDELLKNKVNANSIDKTQATRLLDAISSNITSSSLAGKTQTSNVPFSEQKTGVIGYMKSELAEAKKTLKQAYDNSGLSADIAEGVRNIYGSHNTNSAISADIQKLEGVIAELEKCKTEDEFKSKYKELLGVEFNYQSIQNAKKARQKANQVTALQISLDKIDRIEKDFEVGVKQGEGYNSFTLNRKKDHQDLIMILGNGNAQAGQQKLLNILAENGVTDDKEKLQVCLKLLKALRSETQNQLNTASGGYSPNQVRKAADDAYTSAYGKHQFMHDVKQYADTQETVDMIGTTGAKIALALSTIAIPGISIGGAALFTAGTSMAVDGINQSTTADGLTGEEMGNALKEALVSGGLVYVGGKVTQMIMKGMNGAVLAKAVKDAGGSVKLLGKGLVLGEDTATAIESSMGKAAHSSMRAQIAGKSIAETLASRGYQLTEKGAATMANVGIAAAAEYVQTGEITVQGMTMAVVMTLTGEIIAFKVMGAKAGKGAKAPEGPKAPEAPKPPTEGPKPPTAENGGSVTNQTSTPVLDQAIKHQTTTGGPTEIAPAGSVHVGEQKLAAIKSEIDALCAKPNVTAEELAATKAKLKGLSNNNGRVDAMIRQLDQTAAALPTESRIQYQRTTQQNQQHIVDDIFTRPNELMPSDVKNIREHIANINDPAELDALAAKLKTKQTTHGGTNRDYNDAFMAIQNRKDALAFNQKQAVIAASDNSGAYALENLGKGKNIQGGTNGTLDHILTDIEGVTSLERLSEIEAALKESSGIKAVKNKVQDAINAKRANLMANQHVEITPVSVEQVKPIEIEPIKAPQVIEAPETPRLSKINKGSGRLGEKARNEIRTEIKEAAGKCTSKEQVEALRTRMHDHINSEPLLKELDAYLDGIAKDLPFAKDVQTTPAPKPAPVVEQTPVVEPAPVVAEPAHVVEPTPVVEPAVTEPVVTEAPETPHTSKINKGSGRLGEKARNEIRTEIKEAAGKCTSKEQVEALRTRMHDHINSEPLLKELDAYLDGIAEGLPTPPRNTSVTRDLTAKDVFINPKIKADVDRYCEIISNENSTVKEVADAVQGLRKNGLKYENGKLLPLVNKADVHQVALGIREIAEPFRNSANSFIDRIAETTGAEKSYRIKGDFGIDSLEGKITKEVKAPHQDQLLDAVNSTNPNDAMSRVFDLYGARFLAQDQAGINKIFNELYSSIQKGEFIPDLITNYKGTNGTPYFSKDQLLQLKALCDKMGYDHVKFPSIDNADGSIIYSDGYTSAHVNGRIRVTNAQGVESFMPTEIQIRTKNIQEICDAMHIPYDIIENPDKNILSNMTPEQQKIASPMVERFKAMRGQNNALKDQYYKYQTDYLNAVKENSSVLPKPKDYGLPEEVSIEKIIELEHMLQAVNK